MTPYEAVMLIEDPDEGTSEEEILEAWQYLIDTGIVWTLQGSYGRMAVELIEMGVVRP